jgi:hypothetical protein
MAQSTATSKRQGKIAAELTLLWPILRRWPGGYSFGEYLNAIEQHQIRLRAQTADDCRPSPLPRPQMAGARRSARNPKRWLLRDVNPY